MATQIAEAYVQIKPTTKGIKNELKSQLGGEVSSAGDSAGESFGSSMVSKLKGIIAAAGIGAVIKEALDAGGAVQQSFGGLDTLYGDASEAAKAYAKEAVSAGISMNDYAEQAVSFGAGLKAAFGGDTAKAVEAANTAILDMADNAAKMGTPLESIQNAYQGFAKGNYTMLDNLKLGYGGTKQEMERLLADAEKLSGVKYDMSNLGDVYSAIHVIQEDLGLTGVAAQEAAETFSGSMGAMKAATTNLLASLTTGENLYEPIQKLFETVRNFVFNNLVPMLKNIFESIPQLLANTMFELGDTFSNISQNMPQIIEFAVNLITDLADAFVENTGILLKGAWDLISSLVDALLNYDWMSAGQTLVRKLIASIQQSSYDAFGDSDIGIIEGFAKQILDKIPEVMELGGNLLLGLVEGISSALPSLLEGAAQMLTAWWDALAEALPKMFEQGAEILSKLIDGIIDALPKLIETALKVIVELVNNIGKNLPKILQAGIELLGKLAEGIIKAIPKLVAMLPQVFTAIINAFKNVNWLDIGINIMEGIKNGIVSAVKGVINAVKDAAGQILDSAKGFLGIHSPSRVFRDEIGAMIPEGMAIGIKANTDSVTKAMDDLTMETISAGTSGLDFNYNYSSPSNTADSGIDRVISLLSQYLPTIGNQQIVLDGNVLVGATASRMDSALGQIASRSGRGVAIA